MKFQIAIIKIFAPLFHNSSLRETGVKNLICLETPGVNL